VALIDKNDDLHQENADVFRKIIAGTRKERYKVPIPVIGEAFLILNEKRDNDIKREAFKVLETLIEEKRIELIAFGKSNDAFRYAKELMDQCTSDYRQENLAPMDALIVADALIDNQCTKIYTNDTLLLFDKNLRETVNEIRRNIDSAYSPLEFSQFKKS